MTQTLVGVVQMTSTADVEANLVCVEDLVEQACARGARLVVLPECFGFLGPGDGKLDVAESLSGDGPILARCASLAVRHGVELLLGGFWELCTEPGKVYNTAVHLDADGQVRAVYRKIHLFDVDLHDGTAIRESDSMVPGQDVVVADTVAGRMGLSICYDVRFPELYRRLVDGGARVLAVPAAFTLSTGKEHWHVLLRARAIESQCYVLAAAQTGRHFGNRFSYGHAMIVDPWGVVIAQCGEGPGVAVAPVELDRVDAVRAMLPSLQHRRL